MERLDRSLYVTKAKSWSVCTMRSFISAVAALVKVMANILRKIPVLGTVLSG